MSALASTHINTKQVDVRGPKVGSGGSHSRELYYDMKKGTVTVGMLRGRVSHEMAHPANQVCVLSVRSSVLMPTPLASFFTTIALRRCFLA